MEAIVGATTEVSRVISAVSTEYYAEQAPAALAGRLARLHQKAWESVMAGERAGEAYAELGRTAEKLFNARQIVETADQHIVWALTPVIAASLACSPGDDRISLRDVSGAIWRLLTAALAETRAPAYATRRAA